MLKKRIIPCLDIKDGRTVKGINFMNLKDAGDPVALATKYAQDGADELVFLDICATEENRSTLVKLVSQIAAAIHIPFTVGGGINSVEAAAAVLEAGADKVSVNSAAVKNPALLSKIARRYGSQAVVLAIDARKEKDIWEVYISGGKKATGKHLTDWVMQGIEEGAGEILLTSMDCDGAKNGFDLAMLQEVGRIAAVPVIASGGAGNMQDFKNLFEQTTATGALAASVFHYNEIQIPGLKNYLNQHQIPVRL
ncbi:MAG: imidazole glycerol phosphate synthase subunit HisF [Ferruginibacter sp.]